MKKRMKVADIVFQTNWKEYFLIVGEVEKDGEQQYFLLNLSDPHSESGRVYRSVDYMNDSSHVWIKVI